ncbi:putative lipid II flippase FtsW [Patescibacteria group bacterium]|nr:putative lipid II flippase FtsW [Patescibacteria group bacterium]
MVQRKKIDRILLGIVLVLVSGGFLIFSSASLGLLGREGARFSSIALSQFVFGIVGGLTALTVMSAIHYRFWRKYAFYLFVIGLALTLAVFIPGLGMSHGGARRWLSIGTFSFQPAEFLKIAFVVYTATWLSGMQRYVETFWKGTLPFLGILAVTGIVMLLQPDTDTFLIMAAAGGAMFITAGGRWRDMFIIGIVGILLLGSLALMRPYVMDRLMTFANPAADPHGAGYQIQQSLIAIGSGGVTGRGFGQSIQKFEYLPEPISDSIFAVFSEEFGFIGGSLLITLFTFFAFRGYKLASQASDIFGTLLVVGFITVITTQAFLNIAAMLGVAPLSGLPLPFISHGGTAMLMTLASVGIVLNVSRYVRTKKD